MSAGTRSGIEAVAPMASAISSASGREAPGELAHLGQVVLEQPEAGVRDRSRWPRTTRRGATRHISARPAAQSSQWCTVRMAMATSAQPEGSGSAEPLARTAGAAPAGRWLHHDAGGLHGEDGPVRWLVGAGAGPDVDDEVAPSPRCSTMTASQRGSARRWAT